MADEIVVEEAPEEVTEEGPDIVVAPVIVNTESEPEAPVETHCEHCEQHAAELAELREKIGVLTGIEALLVEDEIAEEEAVEEEPPVETVIEGEQEPEAPKERHAGVFI